MPFPVRQMDRRIDTEVTRAGLSVLGGFDVGEQDNPALPAGCATLVLLGWAGPDQWQYFAASPEYADGRRDPLDRWTSRVVDPLAEELGASPLYPFGGPPWLPFQTWALAAGIAHKSPIGLLIHPMFGLWHSYRAALAFRTPIALPTQGISASPCDSCLDRPCLTTCPIGAYTPDHFAYEDCRDYNRAEAGRTCRDGGCLARAACPVGREHRYSAEQVAFHQRAFVGPIA